MSLQELSGFVRKLPVSGSVGKSANACHLLRMVERSHVFPVQGGGWGLSFSFDATRADAHVRTETKCFCDLGL